MAGWMVGGARACLTAHIPLGGGEGRGGERASRFGQPEQGRQSSSRRRRRRRKVTLDVAEGHQGRKGGTTTTVYIYISRCCLRSPHWKYWNPHRLPLPLPSVSLVTSRYFSRVPSSGIRRRRRRRRRFGVMAGFDHQLCLDPGATIEEEGKGEGYTLTDRKKFERLSMNDNLKSKEIRSVRFFNRRE